MNLKIAPLPGSFMIISIVGLFISINIYETYPSWAFSFMFIFVMMLIASVISMTYAPLGSYDLKKEGILKKGEKE